MGHGSHAPWELHYATFNHKGPRQKRENAPSLPIGPTPPASVSGGNKLLLVAPRWATFVSLHFLLMLGSRSRQGSRKPSLEYRRGQPAIVTLIEKCTFCALCCYGSCIESSFQAGCSCSRRSTMLNFTHNLQPQWHPLRTFSHLSITARSTGGFDPLSFLDRFAVGSFGGPSTELEFSLPLHPTTERCE